MYSFFGRGFFLLRVYLVQYHFTPKINMYIIYFLKLKTYYSKMNLYTKLQVCGRDSIKYYCAIVTGFFLKLYISGCSFVKLQTKRWL